MTNQMTLIVGATIMALLVIDSVGAEELNSVRIPDQTVTIHTGEPPNLYGTFRDGEYAGVKFFAVPDASLPLPPEYQPKNLLAELDPLFIVESVGLPPFDGLKSRDQILAALPQTIFRLQSLITADGQKAFKLGEPSIIVYVTRYKTAPAYPPLINDLKDGHYLEDKRVYISAYNVSFGNLPSCSEYIGLCSSPK